MKELEDLHTYLVLLVSVLLGDTNMIHVRVCLDGHCIIENRIKISA